MIDAAKIDVLIKRQAAKVSRARGEQAEIIIGHRLRALGVLCLERVTTPKTSRVRSGKLQTRYLKKVSGDWRGVCPGGRSMLCEVKYRPDRLCLSDLKPHQRESLTEHTAAGGLSLVGWQHAHGIAIFAWVNWSGDAMSPVDAQRHALTQLTSEPAPTAWEPMAGP